MTTGVTVVTGLVEGFDYAALDMETRVVVQQRTGEIRSLVRRSAQDIIEIGLKLGEVKGKLGHGEFGRWLKLEFQWSQNTANRFMQVGERFGQIPQIGDFAPSALYLLAEDQTPDEAVKEALERAEGGERITHAAAKAIVEGHRDVRVDDDGRVFHTSNIGASRPVAASSQATAGRYASGLPVLDMPGANGGGETAAGAAVEQKGLGLRWRPAAAPEGWDAEDEAEYAAVLPVWQRPALEIGIGLADELTRVRVARRLMEERRDDVRFTLERRMWELVRREQLALAAMHPVPTRTAEVAEDAEGETGTVDPWVAAWTQRQYDKLTDRCQRLAVAMVDWGRAWTDDKGRSWIDVVNRNPWHANSPFRQDAVAECRRRGLSVFEEGMAETIRRLFGLLVESDNLLLSDGDDAGVTSQESGVTSQGGETLTANDLQVMQTAPEVSAEPEWEVDGDRPLPAWVSAWADGGPAPALGSVATEDAEEDAEEDSYPEEQAPVSQREGYDSDEWYTPGWVIEAARRVMGEIDLDPASCELAQEVVGAGLFWTKGQDGCRMGWFGRVWLNPPYSAPGAFVEKLIEEYAHGNVRQAVVLLNNSTETRWFQRLLARFPACFFSQRLAFWRHDHADVGARQGQAVFYLGQDVERFCEVFGEFGIVVRRVD